MKLFVWCDPYAVEFGSSMVVAVAETVEEAREQAGRGEGYTFGECKEENPPRGLASGLGEPTRVVECPCAEWHKWEE